MKSFTYTAVICLVTLFFGTVVCPATAAGPNWMATNIGTFSGVEDLDLTGTFPYAVNFGNGDGSWPVSPDVTFRGENYVSVGAGTNGANLSPVNMSGFSDHRGWGTKPVYAVGGTFNDTLATVIHDIRYVNSSVPAGDPRGFTLDVTPGQVYKLQLLVSLNDFSDRGMGFAFGGRTVVDNFLPWELQSPHVVGGAVTNGVVLTYEFMATQNTFQVDGWRRLIGGHILNEAIFNALTLEHLTDSVSKAIPLTSINDLNLKRSDKVVYAVNVGDNQDLNIRGVTFHGDRTNPEEGFYGNDMIIRSSNPGNLTGGEKVGVGWDQKISDEPEVWVYHPRTDNAALNSLLESVRYTGNNSAGYAGVEMSMAVTPGNLYQLDLFFHEFPWNSPSHRVFDVLLDGNMIVEGFYPQMVARSDGSDGSCAMLTLEYTAVSDVMNVVLGYNNNPAFSANDRNPLLSGLLLRDITNPVPEPTIQAIPLKGVGDLLLNRGKIIYAVNVSRDVDVEVDGVTFHKEGHYGSNAVINSNNIASVGDAGTGDDNLNSLLESLRWSDNRNDGIEIRLAVEVGRQYELDLLFHDFPNYTVGARIFDIFVDDLFGDPLMQGFDILAAAGHPDNTNAMLTISYTAFTDEMLVWLRHGAADNPSLSGLLLRDVTSETPEPATWGMLLLGGAAVTVFTRRKHKNR